MPDTDTLVTELFSLLVRFVPKVVGVIVLLVVTWMVASYVGRRVARSVEHRLDVTLSRFFGNVVRYLVLVMGILGCLRIFGFETTSFAAVLGAAGLAVGLALQGTLSNFSAGIMLLAFRPFKVDDVVSVSGITGKVTGITLFTTEFDTPDNRRIIVPNGRIFGSTIENITHHDTRRVDVEVGTDYAADLARTRAVLLAAAGRVEGRLDDPAPAAILLSLGDSSIGWSVRVWAPTADFFAVRERLTQAVKEDLDAAGIGIPYPQMDVHLPAATA